MAEPFYITTAISYPNGRPHIGHAYEAIAADAIARFQRSRGRDVKLVTGTDEHGLKMIQTARGEGRETLEFADEMSGYFRVMYERLNISYDDFVRTSEPRHHRASIAIWKAMEEAGDLYLDRYAAVLDIAPSLIARAARGLDGAQRERALDAYAKARELAAIAPRLSLDPAATVFQLGGILALVPHPPVP